MATFTFANDKGVEITAQAESVRIIEDQDGFRHIILTRANGCEDSYGGSLEWGAAIPQALIDAAGGISRGE